KFSYAGRGENSTRWALRNLQRRDISCPARCGRLDRAVAGVGPNQQRRGDIRRLYVADALAGEASGVLPSPGESTTTLGNHPMSFTSNWHYGGGGRSAKVAALLHHRLAVVPGDACAGDRISASRLAGPGRPIYLSTTNRPLHSDHLGYCRCHGGLALATWNFYCRHCNCGGSLELARLGPSVVLARSRVAVYSCACRHLK